MSKLTRRALIFGSVAAGGAAVFALSVPTIRREIRAWRAAKPLGNTPWIRIDHAGTVTVYANVTEMGQGAVSGLMQGVAEELDVPWEAMGTAMAPVNGSYSAPWGYSTGGSRSIRALLTTYRQLGAGARLMLMEAAAQRWDVPVAECSTLLGEVLHVKTQRRLQYGVIAEAAARVRPPGRVTLKSADQWRYLGKSMRRLDTAAKVDGTAIFGIDVQLPDMKVAAVQHCPVLGGKLRNVDPIPAMAMPGVHRVVGLGNAVAVVADTYWQASRGLATLQPDWDTGSGSMLSTEGLRTELLRLLSAGSQREAAVSVEERERVDAVESELAGTDVVTAMYEVPLLAQAPAEPMNATARVTEDLAEIWAPTQAQSDAQYEVADALGMPRRAVRIHPMLVGGGFGRRLSNDYAIQAARIARVSGMPVKLVWSREEDMRNSTFRTAAMARLRAKLRPDGLPALLRAEVSTLHTYRRTGGLDNLPYSIPETVLTYAGVDTAVPIGSWRSVDMSQNTFFAESFLDECAIAANRDPVEYRLALLAKNPRAVAVLNAVAQLADWYAPLPDGHARGLAFAEEFGSVIAQVAEVQATQNGIAIRRISCALDCGMVVNPGSVEAQVEGGVIYALSAALFGEITVEAGRIQQQNFDSYRVLRCADVPEIRIRLLDNLDASPGGVGEIPVPAVAPAVANAISRLTGKRIRTLPMVRQVPLAV